MTKKGHVENKKECPKNKGGCGRSIGPKGRNGFCGHCKHKNKPKATGFVVAGKSANLMRGLLKNPNEAQDEGIFEDLTVTRKVYVKRGSVDAGLAVRKGAISPSAGYRGDMWDRSGLHAQGVSTSNISGIEFHDVDNEAFTPGRPIVLKPNPNNKYDSNAVEVWGYDQNNDLTQAGFVPKELAAALNLQDEKYGVVLSEWITKATDTRQSLEIAWADEPFGLVVES